MDARALRDTVAAEAHSHGAASAAELLGLEDRYRATAVFLRRRIDLRITQQRLAAMARVPRDTISELENGQANPSLSTLTALASALDCTLVLGVRPRDAGAAEG